MTQRSVCVFCSSSPRLDPRFYALATRVGTAVGSRGMRLVYGGANAGTMGSVANATLAAGGTVFGVIPRSLVERELAHHLISELVVVESLHARKERMELESDAFLVLPGGFGTLDELFDVLTLRQVGLHQKRVALLNADGFYDPLLAWVHRAIEQRFVPPEVADALEVLSDEQALDAWLDTVRR